MGEGAERPGKGEQKARKSTERPKRRSTESREKEHREPAREQGDPEGVADSRETPGLLGGWSGLKVGGRDTGRQRYRGFEGRRETETRREKEK